jgi:hypothetical protein
MKGMTRVIAWLAAAKITPYEVIAQILLLITSHKLWPFSNAGNAWGLEPTRKPSNETGLKLSSEVFWLRHFLFTFTRLQLTRSIRQKNKDNWSFELFIQLSKILPRNPICVLLLGWSDLNCLIYLQYSFLKTCCLILWYFLLDLVKCKVVTMKFHTMPTT